MKNKFTNRSSTLAGFLGNFLEHYDSTLFSLVAPCLAALFFADLPLLTGLIATFAITSVGILTRPLGALVFGRIGDKKGREAALFITLTGMGIATVCIGLLPTSHQIGAFSWLLLTLLRSLQDFFAEGESKGSAIFLLEKTKETSQGWISSLYASSSMLGILAASGLVTVFAVTGILEDNWRWLFWIGGLTALVGILLRASSRRSGSVLPVAKARKEATFSILYQQRKALVAIMLASGFSYTTYTFPFVFMTAFAPLISEFTTAQMLEINTLLLVVDMLLLPCFGILTKRFSAFKMMGWASLGAGLLAMPLFTLLHNPSETNIILVRTIIMILGVAFAAPFYMWTLSIVPKEHRYTVISFGYAVGSRLLGVPGVAISLWLYQVTGLVIAPAAYLCVTGLAAAYAIWRTVLRPLKIPEATN